MHARTQLSDPPLRDVAGKTAFITGGSSGIGLGIARACAKAGMRVVLTYRTHAHFEYAQELLGHSRNVYGIEVDVTDRAAMHRAAKEVDRLVGAVHLLVANAGIGLRTRVVDATFDDWDYVIGVNIGGVINTIQIFLPRILAHGEPAHILSTSSMSGLFHGGTAGIYTTTKFAVVGLMEALRTDLLSTQIGVSVFCPGYVESNIGLSQRNRPEKFSNSAGEPQRADGSATVGAGMDPLECGRRVLDGIRNNDMYILTHSEFRQGVVDRFHAILKSFRSPEGAPPERIRAEKVVLRGEAYVLEKSRQSQWDPNQLDERTFST